MKKAEQLFKSRFGLVYQWLISSVSEAVFSAVKSADSSGIAGSAVLSAGDSASASAADTALVKPFLMRRELSCTKTSTKIFTMPSNTKKDPKTFKALYREEFGVEPEI